MPAHKFNTTGVCKVCGLSNVYASAWSRTCVPGVTYRPTTKPKAKKKRKPKAKKLVVVVIDHFDTIDDRQI